MKKILSITLIALFLFTMLSCTMTTYTLLDKLPISLHIPRDAEVIGKVEHEEFVVKITLKPFFPRHIDISPMVKKIFRDHPEADGLGNLTIKSKLGILDILNMFVFGIIGETVVIEGILFKMPEDKIGMYNSEFEYKYNYTPDGEGLESIELYGYILRKDFEEALKEKSESE